MSINLLILSNQSWSNTDPHSIFGYGSLNRALEHCLNTHPIRWRIHHPLSAMPDLRGVDVALTWCHHIAGSSRQVRERAITVEDQCLAESIPVCNSARNLHRIRHSFCLHRWMLADIPCALSQPFSRLDDVALRYPLVLRVDGGSHSSLDSFLAEDRTEAECILRERERSPRNPLNLAIEFVDTKFPDGLYRKRRCIVIGDTVLPRQHMVSSGWKVKLSCAESNALSVAENREFLTLGETESAQVAAAAGALGCDILAIDYSPTPSGGRVFWEANRRFRMAGPGAGPKAKKFRESTGRSIAECAQFQNAVSAALGRLLLNRAAGGSPALSWPG